MCRWIDKIEYIGEHDGMCISVDRQDGLYLANDFIVTHNSAIVSWLILWAISTHEDTRGVVTANTDTQLRAKTWAELAKWYRLFIAKDLFKLRLVFSVLKKVMKRLGVLTLYRGQRIIRKRLPDCITKAKEY